MYIYNKVGYIHKTVGFFMYIWKQQTMIDESLHVVKGKKLILLAKSFKCF